MASSTLDTRPEAKLEAPRELRQLPAHPFGLMRRLSHELDRVFEEFGMRPLLPIWPREAARETFWAPTIDVFERKGELIVRADLPGLTRENVKVTATDEILTIEGERRLEEKTEDFLRTECTYGRFVRTLPLPEGAMGDRAQATFRNGVLEIVIPVPPRPERKPHQVDVK